MISYFGEWINRIAEIIPELNKVIVLLATNFSPLKGLFRFGTTSLGNDLPVIRPKTFFQNKKNQKQKQTLKE